MNFVDSSPGWVMQISGADLSKDGPVTVTLDRTFRHPERDALGGIRSEVSYVIDHTEPGKLVGYWGGYTDWHKWAYQCTSRPAAGCDGVGYYRTRE